MLRQQHPKQVHFDEVCRLAIAQDKEGLSAYLAANDLVLQRAKPRRGDYVPDLKHLCVHCKQTPIYHLAKTGEKAAVTFLLDHFNSSSDDSLDNASQVYEAIEGFAEHGDVDEVDAMISNKRFHGANVSKVAYAVKGYAHAENQEQTNRWLNKTLGSQNLDSLGVIFTLRCAMFGWASSGNLELAAGFLYILFEDVFNQYNSPLRTRLDEEDRQDLYSTVVCAFAAGGYVDHVNYYLKRKDDLRLPMLAEDAMLGYAIGGYLGQLEEMLSNGVNYEYYRHMQDEVDEAVCQFGLDHYLRLMHVLHPVSYLNDIMTQRVAPMRIDPEFHCEFNEDKILHSLTLLQPSQYGYGALNAEYLKQSNMPFDVDAMHKQATEIYPLMKERRLTYKHAKEMQRLMDKYNLNFEQATILLKQKKGTMAWLLQGMNVMYIPTPAAGTDHTDGQSPSETRQLAGLPHARILSYLFGTSDVEAHKIRYAASKEILDGTVAAYSKKLNNGDVTPDKYIEDGVAAIETFKARTRY